MKHLLPALLCLFYTSVTFAQEWVDVTDEYVTNPDFNGSIDGWTDTYSEAAQNHGYQSANYRNGSIRISQFAEAWRDKSNWRRLGDAAISQQLTLIPAGKYRLEADAIGVYQGDESTPVTGVLLFLNDGTNEATSTISTGNGKPEHFSVEMTTSNSQLTIGVCTRNTTANWLAFDNVKLYWYGTVKRVTGITLAKESETLQQGEQLQLTPTFIPADATYKGLAFTSSNEAVASVDQNGLVQALKPGITTITVTSTKYGNVSARCIITVTANEVAPDAIIINEIQQANVDMFVDPSFNYGGWIELFNKTEKATTLDGLYISDDPSDLKKFALTTRLHGTIPAKGFCTLWFDHYSMWTPKTINFKLDCDGGTILISNEAGTVLQRLDYPPAITRTSYARKTDGGNEWGYTDEPTPAATNTTASFATIRLAVPAIDTDGCFFTGNILAQVTNIPSGATLRYTLDGSTPTLDNGMTSTDGLFAFDHTAILRLRFFQDGYLSSPVVTRSYIYKDKNYTLPVISLVSNRANLYGNELGIFVQGNGNGRPGNGQSGACNWNMDWERPANIEFFTEDGYSAFNQEVGIEATGGWSRAWTPHSFNIKANKIYEGNNRLNYQFFKNKPFLRHKALKVRNGGNDTNDRIKDPAIQQVVTTSDVYAETQSYRPVHIFHNGDYIGVQNLREPNNKNYAFANYGIDTDNQDQWKMSPDSGYVQQEGTKEVWDEWYSLAMSADDALSYERIKQIVDIEEYLNYMAIELYIAGTDWPKNNIKAFRERSEGTANSRFRFVLFDTDGAFATDNAFNWFKDAQWWTFDQLYGVSDLYPEGRLYREIEFVTIFLNMLQNETFKKQFIDQFCLITGSVFEPSRVQEVINEMLNHVNPAMSLEGRSASSSGNSVKNSLSESRQSSVITNMRNFLGLDKPLQVTLSSNIEEARLQVNGLQVPTNKFSGKLFAPITLKSSAPAGYQFLGWQSSKGNINTTTLFSKGSDWLYYDQGSLDGDNWKAQNYNATWNTGYAPLGYFTSDAYNGRGYQTFLNYGNNASSKYPTYYFRKQVNLSSAPKSTESFTLDWVADDGFVIYVNGTEAGRFLMNNTPNPSFYSYADTYAEANPESGQMNLDPSLFKKGNNIIAVELHNNNASSTDIYWDAALFYDQADGADSFISTNDTFTIPEEVSNVTYTAVYEKLNDLSDASWDAHPVKINEVSAGNEIYVNDIFKKNDWIELYNTTDEPYDINGMYLSDNISKPEKYQIIDNGTASTVIPPHGHLIIWCDKQEGMNQLHADFKLSNADSCSILLTAADKSWADTLTYCAHTGYQTVGLFPDGGSQLYVMERPTIGKSNTLTTSAIAYEEPKIKEPEIPDVVSNTTDEDLALHYADHTLTLTGAPYARVDIYDMTGCLLLTTRLRSGHPLNLSTLPPRNYVATATANDTQTTLRFILQ